MSPSEIAQAEHFTGYFQPAPNQPKPKPKPNPNPNQTQTQPKPKPKPKPKPFYLLILNPPFTPIPLPPVSQDGGCRTAAAPAMAARAPAAPGRVPPLALPPTPPGASGLGSPTTPHRSREPLGCPRWGSRLWNPGFAITHKTGLVRANWGTPPPGIGV